MSERPSQASDALFMEALERTQRTWVSPWQILARLTSTYPEAVLGALDALETSPAHRAGTHTRHEHDHDGRCLG